MKEFQVNNKSFLFIQTDLFSLRIILMEIRLKRDKYFKFTFSHIPFSYQALIFLFIFERYTKVCKGRLVLIIRCECHTQRLCRCVEHKWRLHFVRCSNDERSPNTCDLIVPYLKLFEQSIEKIYHIHIIIAQGIISTFK